MPSSVIGPRSRGAFALPASLLRERITAMRSAGSRCWSQWASSFPPTTSRNGRRGWAPWLPIRKRRGLTGIKMQRDPTFLGGHLNCPRCGLSIPMRPHRAAIRHCPRCVARSRVIVELFCSTSPAGVLDDGVSLPIVDGDAPLTRGTPATNEASYTEARHQQAHGVDKFGRARPLTLVAKRPMAVSLSAIGERAASPRPRTRLATCPSCSPAGRAGRADPEAGEPARGMAIPRKHQGMDVAHAFFARRELHLPTFPMQRPAPKTIEGHSGTAGAARGRETGRGSRSKAHFAPPVTSILHEGTTHAG